jgi:hypothetical protein
MMFQFIKKYFFLQEKNSLCGHLTDNMEGCSSVKWEVWKNPAKNRQLAHAFLWTPQRSRPDPKNGAFLSGRYDPKTLDIGC